MTKEKPSFDVPCGYCGKTLELLKDSTEGKECYCGDCFNKAGLGK